MSQSICRTERALGSKVSSLYSRGMSHRKWVGTSLWSLKREIITSHKEGREAVYVQGQRVWKQKFRDRSCICRTPGWQSYWTRGWRQRNTYGALVSKHTVSFLGKAILTFPLLLSSNPKQSFTYFLILISLSHLRGEKSFLLHQQTISVAN